RRGYVRATTSFIRLFIRGLAWDAVESGRTFVDTLQTASRAQLTSNSGGKVLTGTSAGGASVTYSLPPMGDLTAGDLTEVCSQLLDEVELICAANADASDEQLVAALLAKFPAQPRLRGIRSFRPDFSRGLCR